MEKEMRKGKNKKEIKKEWKIKKKKEKPLQLYFFIEVLQ